PGQGTFILSQTNLPDRHRRRIAMRPSTWINWLRRGAKKPRRPVRPMLESLEDRCTPASHLWTGAVSTLWSNPSNWRAGGTPLNAPSPTIVFNRTAAVRTTSVVDVGNVSVNAIQFTGSAFALSNSLVGTHISVGAGGISSDSAGVNTVSS